MSKISQLAYVQKLTGTEIWAMFPWSLQKVLCVDSMWFKTNCDSLFHAGNHAVENSWVTRIPCQTSSYCCFNPSKSLIGIQCTDICRCSCSHKYRPGDCASAGDDSQVWRSEYVLSRMDHTCCWWRRAHGPRRMVNLSPKSERQISLLVSSLLPKICTLI